MSDYLEQFESFDEYEDKSLSINNKSSIYLLIYNGNKYVVWEKVNSATTVKYKDENYLEIYKSFYNVINGELILNTYELFDLEKDKRVVLKPMGVYLSLLSDKLELSDNESTVLSREKVLKLTKNSN